LGAGSYFFLQSILQIVLQVNILLLLGFDGWRLWTGDKGRGQLRAVMEGKGDGWVSDGMMIGARIR
jgi:hypothetical protein